MTATRRCREERVKPDGGRSSASELENEDGIRHLSAAGVVQPTLDSAEDLTFSGGPLSTKSGCSIRNLSRSGSCRPSSAASSQTDRKRHHPSSLSNALAAATPLYEEEHDSVMTLSHIPLCRRVRIPETQRRCRILVNSTENMAGGGGGPSPVRLRSTW